MTNTEVIRDKGPEQAQLRQDRAPSTITPTSPPRHDSMKNGDSDPVKTYLSSLPDEYSSSTTPVRYPSPPPASLLGSMDQIRGRLQVLSRVEAGNGHQMEALATKRRCQDQKLAAWRESENRQILRSRKRFDAALLQKRDGENRAFKPVEDRIEEEEKDLRRRLKLLKRGLLQNQSALPGTDPSARSQTTPAPSLSDAPIPVMPIDSASDRPTGRTDILPSSSNLPAASARDQTSSSGSTPSWWLSKSPHDPQRMGSRQTSSSNASTSLVVSSASTTLFPPTQVASSTTAANSFPTVLMEGPRQVSDDQGIHTGPSLGADHLSRHSVSPIQLLQGEAVVGAAPPLRPTERQWRLSGVGDHFQWPLQRQATVSPRNASQPPATSLGVASPGHHGVTGITPPSSAASRRKAVNGTRNTTAQGEQHETVEGSEPDGPSPAPAKDADDQVLEGPASASVGSINVLRSARLTAFTNQPSSPNPHTRSHSRSNVAISASGDQSREPEGSQGHKMPGATADESSDLDSTKQVKVKEDETVNDVKMAQRRPRGRPKKSTLGP